SIDRRHFLGRAAAAGIGALSLGSSLGSGEEQDGGQPPPRNPDPPLPANRRSYTGPNVILVRFGGGVRRRETILDDAHTYCPFIYHELYRNQGVLYNNVEIESGPGVVTSHGQGTLYLLTGKYAEYRDIENQFLAERFEPGSPTL